MRKDMKDIIIEAPRLEDLDNPRGRVGQQDPETLPEQEGMRRRYTGWGPMLGDRLTPLVRFLRSRRGKQWNKVFSEMCEHIEMEVHGCWFQVWYEKVEVAHRRWDYLQQKHVVEYSTKEVLDRKKQLNAKELRSLGLSNEPGWLWYAA